MKKKRVGIRELKNRASRIIEEVCETDEPYVVTKRGKPTAVLRPWRDGDAEADRVGTTRELLTTLDKLAERVRQAAGRRSATTAVSAQRR